MNNQNPKAIPEKTIERLSMFRRVLQTCDKEGKKFIFSHDIGTILHLTPVQVRRDIMLIGYNGTQRKGYEVKSLLKLINQILNPKNVVNVCLVGIGNYGQAIINYIKGKNAKLNIIAAFDNNLDKCNRVISGVKCYHIDDFEKIVKENKISIGIITTPPQHAKETSEKMVLAGIKGVLNFTSTSVNVSPHAYLEEYDMITSLEKLAFYTK